MKAACFIVLALVAVVSAHYEGYPFAHRNEGRYGAAYPYANHAAPALPAKAAVGNGYGYGFGNEHTYRGYGAYPVHLGNGNFQYIGKFNGNCADAANSGFYFAGNADSFVVCDNGKAYNFACPLGTANHEADYYQESIPYGLHDFCSVNTNQS